MSKQIICNYFQENYGSFLRLFFDTNAFNEKIKYIWLVKLGMFILTGTKMECVIFRSTFAISIFWKLCINCTLFSVHSVEEKHFESSKKILFYKIVRKINFQMYIFRLHWTNSLVVIPSTLRCITNWHRYIFVYYFIHHYYYHFRGWNILPYTQYSVACTMYVVSPSMHIHQTCDTVSMWRSTLTITSIPSAIIPEKKYMKMPKK